MRPGNTPGMLGAGINAIKGRREPFCHKVCHQAPLSRSSRDRPRAIVPPRAAPPVGDPGAGRAMPGFVPGSPALNLGEQIWASSGDWTDLFLWLNT